MQASVHASIAAIDAAEWDSLTGPGHLFQSHGFLGVLEDGAMPDYVPRYIAIRDAAGLLVATAAAFIMPTSLITLSSGPVKGAVDAIQRRLPWFLRPRILECGSPLGPGNGISLRTGTDFEAVAAVLAEAFESIARAEGISLIALRDFRSDELAGATALTACGYVPSEGFATMSLAIGWRRYADYLQSMTSRHRQKVRRGQLLAEKSGLTVRWAPIGGSGEQLAQERENVRSLATEYRREQLTAAFFERLDASFGARAQVLEVLQGDRRVGHALVVEDGPVLRWLSFGRRDGGTRDGAYFLVLASIIERAIAEGRSVLDMGITTEGPKTDFGAERIGQWMLLRYRGPLGRLLPLVLPYLNPPRDRRLRRVFKPVE